jgi:hypothetical protein
MQLVYGIELVAYSSNQQRNIEPYSHLALAVLKQWVLDGCEAMPESWFNDLCILSNISSIDLKGRVEYIYGPIIWEEDDGYV